MPTYPYDKKPAFFRAVSPELFFEADSERGGDLESSLLQLGNQPELEAELDAILREARIHTADANHSGGEVPAGVAFGAK